MRRLTVLASAGAVAVAVGMVGFTLGRTFTVREPVAKVTPAKAPEPELVTSTIASRSIPPQQSAPPVAFPPSTVPCVPTLDRADATATLNPACRNPEALGVSRVVEIDAAGGPGFGFEHFKQYDFLREHEVVLTFDDGPWPANTSAVLKALFDNCAKATFFQIGKHAMWHPELAKQVAAAGMTIGSHTWSHKDLAKNPFASDLDQAKAEIEMGVSAVQIAVNGVIAPFFRFPELQHTPLLLSYLGERNIASFSTDIDSFDFKMRRPEQVVQSVMTSLQKRGKGIILMHDFQSGTAEAMPELLHQLKAGGYKIVQMAAKQPMTSLAKYDDMVRQQDKLSVTNTRPQNSVVRTID